jgi:hypothetical protein
MAEAHWAPRMDDNNQFIGATYTARILWLDVDSMANNPTCTGGQPTELFILDRGH